MLRAVGPLEDGRLVLGYERGPFVRETWISATEPAAIDERGLSFALTLEPHGEWKTDVNVVTDANTVFQNKDGSAAAASDVVVGVEVQVSGSVDTTTHSVVATKVVIEAED